MCFICAQREPSNALAASQVHTGRTTSAITDSAIWAGEGLVTETADASASSATAYELTVGQSALGSISSTADTDWYAIDLVAGQTYDIRLLGFGSDFLSDPLVRLRDSLGAIIESNDDGFTSGSSTHERDAALTYTATSTGTFYVQADAYSTQTGTYLLSVTQDVSGDMPEITVDEIAWQLINNGSAYFGATEALAFDVGSDNSLSADISGLTTKGAMFATAALDIWAAYLGFDFEIVTSGAEITFDDADAYWAYAQTYDDGTSITSSIVNAGTGWIADDDTLSCTL
jgi:serralysin